MLTKPQVVKLLGRPLTSIEDSNFDTYLKIAKARLEELLCMDLCDDSDDERTYESRAAYRTLYVDPFKSITSVTIDGNATTDYTIKQFDKFNGSWYNIIEFDRKQTGKLVVVDADWGFDSLPVDLQLLLAQLFAQGSVEQKVDNQVKSKKIGDFSVTYKDGATFDEFVLAHSKTIDKYSNCQQGYIRHGRVLSVYDY